MQVKIRDLRQVIDELFSHLEDVGHTWVEITDDYYWNIPQDYRYDVTREPSEFDIGQLSDDWSELQKILTGANEPISYALVWASSILQHIGEKIVH